MHSAIQNITDNHDLPFFICRYVLYWRQHLFSVWSRLSSNLRFHQFPWTVQQSMCSGLSLSRRFCMAPEQVHSTVRLPQLQKETQAIDNVFVVLEVEKKWFWKMEENRMLSKPLLVTVERGAVNLEKDSPTRMPYAQTIRVVMNYQYNQYQYLLDINSESRKKFWLSHIIRNADTRRYRNASDSTGGRVEDHICLR